MPGQPLVLSSMTDSDRTTLMSPFLTSWMDGAIAIRTTLEAWSFQLAPVFVLAEMVQQSLQQDPLSGNLFVFRNRRGDKLKILYWDSDGFAQWYKRLEEGTFRFPRIVEGQHSVEVKASELAMLLEGIDLRSQAGQAIQGCGKIAPRPKITFGLARSGWRDHGRSGQSFS